MKPRLLLAALLLVAVVDAAASEAQVCPASAEDAALQFVTLGLRDPRRVTPLIRAESLHRFRLRLEQLADPRYSPDSDLFRTTGWGPDWSFERLSSESDAGVVGPLLAAGQVVRTEEGPSNLRVTRSWLDPSLGRQIEVRYVLATARGPSEQQRVFTAHLVKPCWQLDIPTETWAHMLQISKALKASRGPAPATNRTGPSSLRLQVAAASSDPSAGARAVPVRGGAKQVWMASTPLATESNLLSARASWDCEQGLGPEDPAIWLQFDTASARRIEQWTEANRGRMLAVAIDNEVVTFAMVTTALKDRVTVCLRDGTLEDATRLAARLMGAAR